MITYASPDEYAFIEFPFEVTSVSSVDEASLMETVAMFPNPTQGFTNVQFSSAKAGRATLEVLNLIGERVISQDFGTLPAGEHRLSLDKCREKARIY